MCITTAYILTDLNIKYKNLLFFSRPSVLFKFYSIMYIMLWRIHMELHYINKQNKRKSTNNCHVCIHLYLFIENSARTLAIWLIELWENSIFPYQKLESGKRLFTTFDTYLRLRSGIKI